MSTGSSTFRGAAGWRLVAALSSILTALLAFRLLDQYLGKSKYGLIMIAVNLVGLLPQFDGGYRLVINRRLLQENSPERRRDLVYFAQALYSWGSLAAGIIGIGLLLLYSLAPIAQASDEPLSFYIALGSVGFLAVLGTSQTQLLIGLHRQKQLFVLNALAAWLYLGVLWGLLKLGQLYWSFPIAQSVFLVVPTTISWWIARQELPELRLLDFRWKPAYTTVFHELWKDAAPAFLSQLVIFALYASDGILATRLLSETAATEVALAATLFAMLRRSLQSADEAIWPRLASAADGASETSASLVRMNSWIYGTLITIAGVCLPAFVQSYAPRLAGDPWVIWLFAVRYFVSGLASQPAYYLMGHGRFGEIARHITLEWVVAVILSFLFAPRFGASGIAGAFALATLVGVAVPLPWAYAEEAQIAPRAHFAAVWSRALVGAVLSGGFAWVFLRHASSWPGVIAAAMLSALVSWGFIAGWAAWRTSHVGRVDLRGLAKHL